MPRPGAAVQTRAVEPLAGAARVDLFGSTLLEWRGIRRNARSVVQADATATAGYQGLTATVGGWTALELTGTGDEPRPDLRVGGAGPAQWSLWAQVGWHRPGVAVTLGAIRDWYVRPSADPSTAEAFAAVRAQAGRWSGSVSLYESLDGVHGAYLEPAITFHHFLNPFTGPALSWSTGVRGGFQLGSRNPEAGPAVPGAEGTGFTHLIVDSRLRVTIDVAWQLAVLVATGPELHFNRDPATKRGRDNFQADVRLWWPLQAGLSWPLRRD